MILPRHERVVLWGFTDSLDSFRHIHRAYAHALLRLGKPYEWMPDHDASRWLLRPGDLVFAVDIEAKQLGAAVAGVDYLLHNIGASHPIWDGLEPERFVRLQVYTRDAERYGEAWGPVRRFDRGNRTLFQPWGTNLLADEFLPPVFSGKSRRVAFVGSVWDGDGQGNAREIRELKRAVEKRGLVWEHHVHVSDEENAALVRHSRIAPAIAGLWQAENDYLPCRVFKNVSYGQLAVTNVPKMHEILRIGYEPDLPSIEEIIWLSLEISEKDWLEETREHQKIVAGYTYAESLSAIERAFEEGR